MQQLSPEFVEHCPVEKGFRLRGLQTTRIEVFVDAAFAFAVTLLVISFDEIPSNLDEMTEAIKRIPAFAASVAQLVWIWYTHNTWSRRFGLDDAMTVILSTALLIIVLVYVYPLRIIFEGAFSWASGQFFPVNFDLNSFDDLRYLFVFLGVGFVAICGLFFTMNHYAARHWQALLLDELERYNLSTVKVVWALAALIGIAAMTLALLLPDKLVPLSGFAYALLGVLTPLYEYRRAKKAPKR